MTVHFFSRSSFDTLERRPARADIFNDIVYASVTSRRRSSSILTSSRRAAGTGQRVCVYERLLLEEFCYGGLARVLVRRRHGRDWRRS
jgi:hypothetical protein